MDAARDPRPGRVALAAASAALLAALAGCGGSAEPNASPSLVPGASSGGKLTIGIPFDEPGIGVKDGDSYSGFDVETAKYVAAALGVPAANITWVEAEGDQRQQLLQSGGADLIVSTFSITDERKQVVDFAGPYFDAEQDLLVRRNEEDITGPSTLGGRTLCTVPGTTSADNVLKRYRGRITLLEKPRYSECVSALASSDVDAVTTDDVILAGFAAEPQYKGKLRVLGKGFSTERYGIGVKKGDSQRVEQVNAALKEYVSDGSWKAALNKTVGPSGYRLPSPPTIG
ncbi:glutamate ABC transporter substrate-binding protein [Microlunatus flavus]|uniref:Glutamate transport system substrate-binding protein n=1 Tax=Microlunatus flavus TaxID=1036181 RepID=A0A1H9CJN9_9ACTN|nr:glutamate ABC transporter substrate-binding protein [Microlunatus flavus]SEQ01281.1 glutamate transport system substrate-binding protein [Microlunatus flavus]